ncbi:winged helix-turn-helix domain-containing protein [Lelliottia amnigena]|uniref:Winged helix-turn-helix domain-containing protein n=1 Tax=Lelliottia amnigena TaxID=61646 RepID=A0ABU7UGP4_LELAM|nr:winged helix-turn-helix domain-containing protein [Enterobacter sp. 166D1]
MNTDNFISLNPISGKVFCRGILIGRLNYSERAILSLLIRSNGEVCGRELLTQAGWPDRYVVPNSLNIAIKNIRLVLNAVGEYESLETIPKVGFRLEKGIVSFENTIKKSDLDNRSSLLSEMAGLSVDDVKIEQNAALEDDDIFLNIPRKRVGSSSIISEDIIDKNQRSDDVSLLTKSKNTGKFTWGFFTNEIYTIFKFSFEKKMLFICRVIFSRSIVVSFLFSIFFYLVISRHTPSVYCYTISEAHFCGSTALKISDISIHYKPNDEFFYGEIDGKGNVFYKIN